MRQLLVQVPKGQGKKVVEIAQAHKGSNLSQFEAASPNGLIDEVIVHLSNRKIEGFLKDLVEANVRFTRANIPNQNTLLAVVYVQPHSNVSQSKEMLQTELTQKIQARLQQQFDATPLVNLFIY